jgi:hypothetical protein
MIEQGTLVVRQIIQSLASTIIVSTNDGYGTSERRWNGSGPFGDLSRR